MTTVFLSGSRKLSRLNEEIRGRLGKMIENNLEIIAGDANGADKAMQAFFAEKDYNHVTIFYVGSAPRNNVGGWKTKKVETDPKIKGRDFYVQKDKAMAEVAEYGLVLWDGKSPGSVQNMLSLVRGGKAVVLYHGPHKRFYSFKTEEDLVRILSQTDDDTLRDIDRKVGLPPSLVGGVTAQQSLFEDESNQTAS